METKDYKPMIYSSLVLWFCAVLTFCINSCAKQASSSQDSQSSQTISAEFTSEEDVKNFCLGKTFRPDYFNISTTVRSSSDVSVKEFSGSTAIVKVWFDMSEVYVCASPY